MLACLFPAAALALISEPRRWSQSSLQLPGNAVHIDELIEEGRRRVDAAKLRTLASESSRLLGKLRLAWRGQLPRRIVRRHS